MMIVMGKSFSSSQRFVCLIEEIVLGNSLVGGMLCPQLLREPNAGVVELRRKTFQCAEKICGEELCEKFLAENCNNRI